MTLTVRVVTSEGACHDFQQSADVELAEAKSVSLRYLKQLHGSGVACRAAVVMDARAQILATLLMTATVLVEYVGCEGDDYAAAWDLGAGYQSVP
jgi:hypothetical protein